LLSQVKLKKLFLEKDKIMFNSIYRNSSRIRIRRLIWNRRTPWPTKLKNTNIEMSLKKLKRKKRMIIWMSFALREVTLRILIIISLERGLGRVPMLSSELVSTSFSTKK